MSSGERAKPTARAEERNPFDVSRRSETEVASEIAKRMAAWKQARGRSSSPPNLPPADAAPREANPPHLSAPVQPTHRPESTDQRAHEPRPAPQVPPRDPAAGLSDRCAPRAPFFASFSVQRAMPPAPSPKKSPGRTEAAVEARQPASPAEAPLAPETRNRDHGPVAPQGTDDRHGGALSAAAANPPQIPERDAQQAAAPAVNNEPPLSAENADEIEVRRAKARATKERWMSAHDSEDSPLAERPGAKAEQTKAEREPQNPGRSTAEAPHVAPAMLPVEKREELSGRREPTPGEAARSGPDKIAASASRAATQAAVPTRGIPDDMPGRKTPKRDETAAEARPAPAASAPPNAEDDRAALETRRIRSAIPPVEKLDELSGRREPTFDVPASKARESKSPPASGSPTASVSTAGRAKRVEVPTMQTRIETRRVDALRADPERMDPLRADPEMAVTIPHAVPEAWLIPSTRAMPPRRERHGTGWAIGLGAVLLIVGLTAPAAIVQQGREALIGQDQVAMSPVPLPPQDQPKDQPKQAPAETQATSTTPPSTTQTESAAAPESPAPAAPDVQPPANQAAQSLAAADKPETDDADPKQEAENVDPQQEAADQNQTQQAALGPVRESGELNQAPVLAPPPPWKSAQAPMVNLASRERADPAAAFRPSSPMVARPFIPDQAQQSFLRPPTVGTATVPIDGGSSSGSQGASVNLRPTLIPQLKPQASSMRTSTAPREFARKPKPFSPQSVEQMFQALVETLGEGKPPNPDAIPRSNER